MNEESPGPAGVGRAWSVVRVAMALRGRWVLRRRKCLIGLTPSFEHELPVWELRAGAFRVFYDVVEEQRIVHVRAVRRKERRQQTEDIA
jgi:hypothetical protein